jgi:hypothetical protein
MEVDEENRKLSLGHKQLEENPWDTFENVFPVGSYHEATVIKKDDRGAIVQLPYGLEAFSPSKHLKKEDYGGDERVIFVHPNLKNSWLDEFETECPDCGEYFNASYTDHERDVYEGHCHNCDKFICEVVK